MTLHLNRRVRGFINILGPQPLHPASGRRRARSLPRRSETPPLWLASHGHIRRNQRRQAPRQELPRLLHTLSHASCLSSASVERRSRPTSLRARGIAVHFEHVRAHRGHHMNERADSLADIGAQTTTHFRASRPLRRRESHWYISAFPHPTSHHTFPPDTVPD